ncbi:hypothetical protein GCM10023160_18880 [Brachybacterium paraconglomeratum]
MALVEAQEAELGEILMQAVDGIWSALGSIVPAELRLWALLMALALTLLLIGEIAIYSRSGRTQCGARTKKGGHCKKPVTNSGPCGAPGHGSGWVAQNILLIALVIALGGRLGGLF